jgi:hypothetical protein
MGWHSWFVVAAALTTLTCDIPPDYLSRPAHRTDADLANVLLCGFPESQLDLSKVGPPSYLVAIGRVRLHQQIRLSLVGDLTRVTSVDWGVTTPDGAKNPPQLRLTATSSRTAVLEGVAVGGDYSEGNFAWVGAGFHFKDGSEGGSNPLVCNEGGWRPAVHVVVDP